MNEKIKLPIVATGLAALLLSFGAPAMAETATYTSTVAVKYQDVDLSTPNGRDKLEHRVNVAIHDMCGSPVFGTPAEADTIDACRSEARSAAALQINAVLMRANTKVASER